MNSNLQNKLSNFQANPPISVWDKIVEALDEEPSFSHRLHRFEEQPKTNVWEKIETTLNQKVPAKIIPLTTRYNKSFRYIAAASIIAVLIIAVSLVLKNTGDSPQTAKEETPPSNNAVVQNPDTSPTKSSNQDQPIIPLQTNNRNNGSIANTNEKRILAFIKPQNILSAVVLRGRFAPKNVYKRELFNVSSLNEHMVYTDPDGTAMKLPKKLISLVSCPDGDGSCNERIKQLRKKLSFNTTSADFTGILEMLRQLQ